jgi:hypothetical protein
MSEISFGFAQDDNPGACAGMTMGRFIEIAGRGFQLKACWNDKKGGEGKDVCPGIIFPKRLRDTERIIPMVFITGALGDLLVIIKKVFNRGCTHAYFSQSV